MEVDCAAIVPEVTAKSWLINLKREKEWYVRFEIAGLYPRRIGPFASADEATAYHEETLREILNLIAGNHDTRHVIEDTLGQAYLTKKGQS